MKLKVIRITPELLTDIIFKERVYEAYVKRARIYNDTPDDMKIVRVEMDTYSNWVLLYVTSETFEEVEGGHNIPLYTPQFTEQIEVSE
jgi:hypothetical protein